MKPKTYTSIGGQAVIEGVMMRSPHFIAVAVRKPNKKIAIRSARFVSIGEKFPFLKKPGLRGVVTLVESMVQGMDSLGYSAGIASTEPETQKQELSKGAIAFSMAFAFLFGMGLFVALPHLLTYWISSLGFDFTAKSPLFHLIDGSLKMLILIAYVFSIGMMEDIKRVFQYHGAEHKSIYAFEAGDDLSVENAKRQSTLHPRCGTSFLLFLVLISVLVFSIAFPLFHLTEFTGQKIVDHLIMVVLKICFMLPVAGLSYELIRACAFRMDQPLFRWLIYPGLLLQNLTTKEPSEDQLEVALASLKMVLRLEKAEESEASRNLPLGEKQEIEIASLAELGSSSATLAEFPEL